MTSCDTNIIFYAFHAGSPHHDAGLSFLRSFARRTDFAICELVLVEFYVLLRNPAVVSEPLSAAAAAQACQHYRQNLNWRVIDYPGSLMSSVWQRAAQPTFPRRGIFDARLAATLAHHGVTRFATHNVKHFQGFGFKRVWSPL